MSSREILFGAAGASGVTPTYIEDVFSTYLYTGTSATQTITNGIDLSGKGGIVWTKSRSNISNQYLVYSDGSTLYGLYPNLTNAQGAAAPPSGHVFNNNGFTIDGSSGLFNFSGYTYASWTFRKQAKFFDIVTYTGNGTAGRTVAHNLGSVPAMMIIKRTNTGGASSTWSVYHTSLGNQAYLNLNTTEGAITGNTDRWNSTTPTSSVFTVGTDASVNQNNSTYVAYLFAHDAGGFGAAGTDNVISCGSYTGNGSTTGPTVNLGYEPQWIMYKQSSSDGNNWFMVDNMRGLPVNGTTSYLIPNTTAAEGSGLGNILNITATGFQLKTTAASANESGATYIYMAIRRGPMATPTSGTSVFSPIASSATLGTKLTTSFPVDSQWAAVRGGDSDNVSVVDRLRLTSTNTTQSGGNFLETSNTGAENTAATLRALYWDNTGFQMPDWYSGTSMVFWNFRRAPGFFDQVCYTGNDVAGRTLNHNLAAVPELMIVKARSITANWRVYTAATGNGNELLLNTTDAVGATSNWNSTTPTSSVFSVGGGASVNASGTTYVAYLFATVAGVSKVGSYTGTGSTQTINAGLPTGARFVLIKRTDDVGNWWIWDTARGMVAGTDPRLALNSTAAEVNNNWVYTVTNGFQIVTTDATVNASGGSYIYLAIA